MRARTASQRMHPILPEPRVPRVRLIRILPESRAILTRGMQSRVKSRGGGPVPNSQSPTLNSQPPALNFFPQEPVQVIPAPVAVREVSRSNRGRRLAPREASRSEADVLADRQESPGPARAREEIGDPAEGRAVPRAAARW